MLPPVDPYIFADAKKNLETFVSEEPLGLQNVVARALLDRQVGFEEPAILEEIIISLIASHQALRNAARQGIKRPDQKPFDENTAAMAAVSASLKPGLARILLGILDLGSKITDRNDLFPAYSLVEAVVAADPIVRRSAQTFLDETFPETLDPIELAAHCAHA